ncbi:MAG: DNA-directed RNA polymerase subunit beta' [Candidatus Spechtbacterales bacterium]|nr:DNA-directed RNA polymerase subunit beta' [Candidatus Spechtbacterales bacterium]
MSRKVSDLKSIQLKIASPEDILSWSHGEVTKPETINYRTQKPEKDGLFCERIFGPEKDYECYCGKYRRIRYKGVICDKCGVEVTRSSVRRERMGHIKLATPIAHIWFLRGVPSRMGMLLGTPVQKLEKVIYYANYIVISLDEEKKEDAIKRVNAEYRKKIKKKNDKEKQKLKELRDKELSRLKNLEMLTILNEYEYHEMSLKYGEIFEASTGSEPVKKVLEEMDLEKLIKDLKKLVKEKSSSSAIRKKLYRRLILAQRILDADIRPEWMFLNYLPVLPPELRPMVQLDGGRYASSDLNDLYRRVINRNNRLKRLIELNAPEVIVRNERRMLQEAVDALLDNSARPGKTVVTATSGGRRALKSLADMLKGKQGRFRQNLLGKRVDYSGRSVIVVGPELDLHQCGLPKKMALELFRPHVINKIIDEELAYNVRAANHLIDEAPPEVWAILEEVIQGKYVLLNRAPTLHRLGVQAFQPVLIEGNAIQLHPLVCTAFNADFDGDQMAVHLPLSAEAQKEAETLMLSSVNLSKPATGAPIVNPTKDMVLGCFWMSKIKEGAKGEGRTFASIEDVRLAYDAGLVNIKAKIKLRIDKNDPRFAEYSESDERFIETCPGRVIFNDILPKDHVFVNEELNSKTLKNITKELFQNWGQEVVVDVLDKIKNLGFHYSTISGTTWSMDDLEVPKEKPEILKEAHKKIDEIQSQFEDGLLSAQERRSKIIEVWAEAKHKIEKLVPNYLDPHGSVALIVASGARGSWAQPVQMMGMKGSVVNPAGQIMEMPVESSYKEGFTALEYFISTHGARKGTADTALRTASAGYLTRRLVDVTQDLIVRSKKCDDKGGIVLQRKDLKETGQTFAEKVFGRVTAATIKDKDGIIARKNDMIDHEKAKQIDAAEEIEEVKVFSPLTCQDESVCARCYGLDLGRNDTVSPGEAVGVVGAQAIGEPGTQLTMRTFHTGGVAGTSDITQGLPRVEEIFEVRTPKGKAVISEVEGKVLSVEETEKARIVKIKTNQPIKTKKRGKRTKGKKTDKKNVIEYTTPLNLALWVEKGDLVVPGTQLTEGHIDLRELFRNTSKEEVQRYIVNEVQKIYTSHGATIHDKHIEIIARQMFSRIRISEPGDSGFSPGEIVSFSEFREANEKLENGKKEKAKGKRLLLGITKVALTTDSFLSAASFQETARVLIRASIEGRKDELKGLKENVIIGKMIPAGTGYKKGK